MPKNAPPDDDENQALDLELLALLRAAVAEAPEPSEGRPGGTAFKPRSPRQVKPKAK